MEGSNFRIEVRWSAGNADRMKALAKEVVDLRPDAILGRGTPVTGALQHADQSYLFGLMRTRAALHIGDFDIEACILEVAEPLGHRERQIEHCRLAANYEP